MSQLRKAAWAILALCDGGILVYGLIILVQPSALLEIGFESYTGEAWSAFQSEAPRRAAYFALVVRMLGAFNVAFGIVALAVILGPFRRQNRRWAWWCLALGNVLAFGVPITADLTAGSIGRYEVIELVMAPLVLLALVVTARKGVGRTEAGAPTEVPGPG